MAIKTVDDLIKAYPDLVAQIADQAVKGAVQAERARNVALDAMDDPNNPELNEIIRAAKNGGINPDLIRDTAEHISIVDYMARCISGKKGLATRKSAAVGSEEDQIIAAMARAINDKNRKSL